MKVCYIEEEVHGVVLCGAQNPVDPLLQTSQGDLGMYTVEDTM